MSFYKYIRETWKNPKENLGELWRKRLSDWAAENSTVRIEHPTRIDKARSLGYKAKPGFIIVRQRVKRGKRQRPKIRKARRSKHRTHRKDLGMSYQWIAEQRAEKAYANCTVLNSYFVGENAMHKWYEVILADREHPQIRADSNISWICDQRGRAQRGLTSAARKSRALRGTGKGFEKSRPSLGANGKRAK